MDELSESLHQLNILRSNFDQNQDIYKNQSSPQHQSQGSKKIGPGEFCYREILHAKVYSGVEGVEKQYEFRDFIVVLKFIPFLDEYR
jgi:hypothetical protein